MGLTVKSVHRMLGQLIEKGYGHYPVVIDMNTYKCPIEQEQDGRALLDVCRLEPQHFQVDDGRANEDSRERLRFCVVLLGEYGER